VLRGLDTWACFMVVVLRLGWDDIIASLLMHDLQVSSGQVSLTKGFGAHDISQSCLNYQVSVQLKI
jgi:hypothetical protein